MGEIDAVEILLERLEIEANRPLTQTEIGRACSLFYLRRKNKLRPKRGIMDNKKFEELKDWERQLWDLMTQMQLAVGGGEGRTKTETLVLYAWEEVRNEIRALEKNKHTP